MRGVIIDFKDLSDAREIIEQKTPRFMLYFFYFLVIMIIALLSWSYLAQKEIVVKTQGIILAEHKHSVTPLVSAKVSNIYYEEGDIVKKGDLILELEHIGLQEKVDYYQTELENYQKQKGLSHKYEQSILGLENLFDKDNKDEMQKYYDFEAFILEYNLIEDVDEQEEVKTRKLIEVYNEIKNNQSYIKQYEIEVLNLEKEINNHKLYSEIDGIIHFVNNVEVGDVLQAGYEAVRVNSNNRNNKLQIYVSNQDISKISVGQVIRVNVIALSNREYGFGEAKVTRIETDARFNQESGQSFYIIEAELLTQTLKGSSDEKELKVGMMVESRMITGEQRYLFWMIEKLGLWLFYMQFVKEDTNLYLKNVIRYRAIIQSNDIDIIIAKMSEYIQSFNGKTTRVLTITQGLNFETGIQKMDMEFIVEANQPIKGNNMYRYLPEYKLNKTVSTNYVGHPQNANMATKEVQQYIQKKKLNPITAVHQVVNNMKKEKKNKKKNEISIEVHVGIE